MNPDDIKLVHKQVKLNLPADLGATPTPEQVQQAVAGKMAALQQGLSEALFAPKPFGKSFILDTYSDLALAAGYNVVKMSPPKPRPEEHIGFMSADDVAQVRALLSPLPPRSLPRE